MVELANLSKAYGSIKVVDNISFEIPKGQITILTGADGSGKSTIFKMLMGLVKKDSGKIFLEGEEIGDDYRKITSICGYMPERFSLYMDLSVEENLNFFADIYKVSKKKRAERKNQLLEKTGMSGFRSRRARDLSGGMKQKLTLSSILLAAPDLIILDEPTTGVDPLSRIEFFTIINELKKEGKTIILSTPYLDEAEQGDYIIFFKNGGIIKKDTITNLKKKFPAKLYKILPEGNIFEALEELTKTPELKRSFYIRGRYLKYLKFGDKDFLPLFPAKNIQEEMPKLEDIYLFYVRRYG